MKYLVYSDDENVENFYLYDSDLQNPNKKNPLSFVSYLSASKSWDNDLKKSMNGKNKRNLDSGCIKSLEKSELKGYLSNPDYKQILVPADDEKYMAIIPNGTACPYGLMIRCKQNKNFDKTSGKTSPSNTFKMVVKCSYANIFRKLTLDESSSISLNGFSLISLDEYENSAETSVNPQ